MSNDQRRKMLDTRLRFRGPEDRETASECRAFFVTRHFLASIAVRLRMPRGN
jgi:hypothetical protein